MPVTVRPTEFIFCSGRDHTKIGEHYDRTCRLRLEHDWWGCISENAQPWDSNEPINMERQDAREVLRIAMRIARENNWKGIVWMNKGDEVRLRNTSYADDLNNVHKDHAGDNPRQPVQTKTEEGKTMSKTFTREHLNKSHKGKADYDRAQISHDLRAMADANDAGHITLITRRVTPDGVFVPASDGSERSASFAFLEWAHS